MDSSLRPKSRRQQSRVWKKIANARYLYFMLLLPVAYVILFNYIPIGGVVMAFQRYSPMDCILGSEWVGLYNFMRFFNTPSFWNILRNTLSISLYSLFVGFPFPIILAVMINHCLLPRFKKTVQTITFAPYFLSAVLLVGLLMQVLSLRSGIVNILLENLGFARMDFMGNPKLFNDIYVWTGIWQQTGYSAIIYISALAGVDTSYHEAARIDGATMWQRIWHIDLATIRPTVVIMIILSMGSILNVEFERAFLMQNPINLSASEIISTYVYKVSVATSRPDYSFGTAIGLFQNVISIILTLIVNKIVDKVTGEGMF